MSERHPSEREYQQILEKNAQDPVAAIKRNFSKGCRASFDFLRILREDITKQKLRIENINPIFGVFLRSSNDDILFWRTLTHMLKQGGFSEIDVRSTFMDLVGEVRDTDGNDASARTKLIEISNAAVDEVYVESKIIEARQIAQDPLKHIRSMKDKNMPASMAIKDLVVVKNRLNAYLGSRHGEVIENVHQNFAVMYQKSDDLIEYYIALFTLLRDGGYTKENCIESTMDADILPKKLEHVKLFIELSKQAISQIYATTKTVEDS